MISGPRWTDSLPPDWQVLRLGDLAERVGSGVTPTGGSEVYTPSGVTFIRSQNVTNSGLLLDDVAYIDLPTHQRMRASAVFPNDVLLNITGASIGRCCAVPADFGEANVNQHVCAIRIPEATAHDAKVLSALLRHTSAKPKSFDSTQGPIGRG
jgi:type I restriction enzyme S subunit